MKWVGFAFPFIFYGLLMTLSTCLPVPARAYTCEDVRHFVATHTSAEVSAVKKTLSFAERHAAAACLPYGNRAGVASALKD